MARKRNQAKRGKSKGGGSSSYGSYSRSKSLNHNNNNNNSFINTILIALNINNTAFGKWINNSNIFIYYIAIFSICILTFTIYLQPQSMNKVLLNQLNNIGYIDILNPFSHTYNDLNNHYHSNDDINNNHNHNNDNNNPSSPHHHSHSNIHSHSPSFSTHNHHSHNNGGNGGHQFCKIQSTPTPNFQRQLENENRGYIELQGCRIVPSSEHSS